MENNNFKQNKDESNALQTLQEYGENLRRRQRLDFSFQDPVQDVLPAGDGFQERRVNPTAVPDQTDMFLIKPVGNAFHQAEPVHVGGEGLLEGRIDFP